MLTELLGSEARVKVLALLLRNADQSFYVREIVRLTGLLPRAVQRELERLTAIRLLRREPRGNQVYYRADQENPIFSDLRMLFLKTVALADPIRDALAKQKGIAIAFIYGSAAAGLDTPESDIDLFIVGTVKPSRISPTVSRLETTLEREINVVLFSASELAERRGRNDPFIESVMREDKIFLIGDHQMLQEVAP